MNKDTQVKQVLRRMQETGSISSMEAFTEFCITRLAAVIHIIRHSLGIDVETEMVTAKNRYGHSVNFARYKLAA